MRYLFLLRGLPGSGKSHWIRENGLEAYTLSTDNLRMMFRSPEINLDGHMSLTNLADRKVFAMLDMLMEDRMSRGELLFVDATHYRGKFISSYKKLASKYRYRTFVVDFSKDVTLEECLRNNIHRPKYLHVPEDTIRKMDMVMKQNEKELPSFAKVITKEQCLDMVSSIKPFDFNDWSKVVVFGDIHGCYQPLKAYFDEHPFDDSVYYIFTGAYIDRGLQNKEVLEFLFTIKDKKNVLLLEGNHERWLRMYANGEDYIDGDDMKVITKHLPAFSKLLNINKIRSREFVKNTLPQIESLDRKEISRLCSKLGQMAYFTYKGKKYCVTHGGIPCLPKITIPTEQYIKGVGLYEDTDKLYEVLSEDDYFKRDTVFIHAHRNILDHDVKVADNIYNLCDEVEWGKFMRVMEISENGIETFKYKNDIHREPPATVNKFVQMSIEALKQSPLVKVIDFGGISSINFTRDAFEKKQWNELTCTARGLFIDNQTDKIIARSYNKFFNYEERESTKLPALKKNLQFPVKAYLKENGFLGIVSVYDNEFMFASKARIDGPFAGYVRELFTKTYDPVTRRGIFDYLKANDCSMVFECVHPEDNTHPIIYAGADIILLDIIKNDLEYKNLPFEEMVTVAEKLGMNHKKLAATINSLEELKEFFTTGDCPLDCDPAKAFEGYVFVDENNFMFKFKTTFYRFWKWQRAVMERIAQNKDVKETAFVSSMEIGVYSLLKEMHHNGILTKTTSIQEVEKRYFEKFGQN